MTLQRREFISLLGGTAAAWPLASRAQQQALPVIGYLGVSSPDADSHRVRPFLEGLSDAGYIEGSNVAIEFRWAERVDQTLDLATELVRMNVDVIFAPASTQVEPARRATNTIPIVFAHHADRCQ